MHRNDGSNSTADTHRRCWLRRRQAGQRAGAHVDQREVVDARVGRQSRGDENADRPELQVDHVRVAEDERYRARGQRRARVPDGSHMARQRPRDRASSMRRIQPGSSSTGSIARRAPWSTSRKPRSPSPSRRRSARVPSRCARVKRIIIRPADRTERRRDPASRRWPDPAPLQGAI